MNILELSRRYVLFQMCLKPKILSFPQLKNDSHVPNNILNFIFKKITDIFQALIML